MARLKEAQRDKSAGSTEHRKARRLGQFLESKIMNKITKIAAIALLTITAGTTLTACGSGKQDSSKQDTKLFAPKEPDYDKSLTLEKIKDSVIGDPKTNETTDLTGKVFKIKVDHIGKSEEGGIKGIVPVDTIKDENGDNIFSIIPNDQGNIKAKAGDTAYLKITHQTSLVGLVILNVDEVTK